MCSLWFNRSEWIELKDSMVESEELRDDEKQTIVEIKQVYRKIAAFTIFLYSAAGGFLILTSIFSSFEFALPGVFQIPWTK